MDFTYLIVISSGFKQEKNTSDALTEFLGKAYDAVNQNRFFLEFSKTPLQWFMKIS